MKNRCVAFAAIAVVLSGCATFETEMAGRYGRPVSEPMHGPSATHVRSEQIAIEPARYSPFKSWASWNDGKAEAKSKKADQPYAVMPN